MAKEFYTFKSLWKDVFDARVAPKEDKQGRIPWGSDPYDLGEGMSFFCSGEELFDPFKCSRDFLVDIPDLEWELKMINLAIDRVTKEGVCEDI